MKGQEYYDSINDDFETKDTIVAFNEDTMHDRVAKDVEKYPSKVNYEKRF